MKRLLFISVVAASLLITPSCTILRYQHEAIQARVQEIKKERDRKADEARRRSALDDRLISQGRVRMGMTKSQVVCAFGKPDFRQTIQIQGTHKYMTVWVYLEKKDCLVFVNNKLKDRQNLLEAVIRKPRI